MDPNTHPNDCKTVLFVQFHRTAHDLGEVFNVLEDDVPHPVHRFMFLHGSRRSVRIFMDEEEVGRCVERVGGRDVSFVEGAEDREGARFEEVGRRSFDDILRLVHLKDWERFL